MKNVLFVADQKVSSSSDEVDDWRNFVKNSKDILAELSGVSMLNEGTFLCKLSAGLHPVSKLALLAKEWRIPSRSLFLDDDPSWVVSKIVEKDAR